MGRAYNKRRTRPCSRARPTPRARLDWYEKAETLAGLTHVKGGGFHAHRRGWQSARKGLPLGDRMVIGGWEDERSARAYERPDERTVKAIIYGKRGVAGGDSTG